jgi:hypothetical protein
MKVTLNIGVYITVNHDKLLIISSVNAICFSPCGPPGGTKIHDLKYKYACKCFEIYEISQIFTDLYKTVIALNYVYFTLHLHTSWLLHIFSVLSKLLKLR